MGFDIDPQTVAGARRQVSDDRVIIPEAGDYRVVVPQFKKQYLQGRRFDALMCIGNTLGTLGGDRKEHIKHMFEHTNCLLVSVVENAKEVTEERIKYYSKNGINCEIDWKTGTITSEAWGQSLAWTREQLEELGKGIGGESCEVRVIKVPPLGLMLMMKRR